jgi:hypothetical protein
MNKQTSVAVRQQLPLTTRHSALASSKPRQISVLAQASSGSGSGPDGRPLLQAFTREPVTFLGGVIAGFLALDIEQDPLKTWVATRAAEAGLAYTAARERLAVQESQLRSREQANK